MIKVCKWCGDILPSQPFYAGRYRFCSRKCVHEYDAAIDAEEREEDRRDRYFEAKEEAEREAEAEAAQELKWRQEAAEEAQETKKQQALEVQRREKQKQDEINATDLVFQLKNGANDRAKWLIANRKESINARSGGMTPLICAAIQSDADIAERLLSVGADINTQAERGHTALIHAALIGIRSAPIVKLLIGAGADVNIQDEDGMTALMHAIDQEHGAIASILIEAKADIKRRNNEGATALCLASGKNQIALTKALISAGANIDEGDRRGMTPVMIAANLGYGRILQALLAAGANVNLKQEMGLTAIMFAAQSSDHLEDIIEPLIKAGADVNQGSDRGETPLLLAVKGNRLEVARALLAAGAKAHEDAVANLVFRAADLRERGMLELLMKNGMNLDVTDENGATALMLAASQGTGECVLSLIESGADLNRQNKSGESAVKIALKGGRIEIADLLKKAGAKDVPWFYRLRYGKSVMQGAGSRGKHKPSDWLTLIMVISTFAILIGVVNSWSIFLFTPILLGTIFWGWSLVSHKPISEWDIGNAMALFLGALIFVINAAAMDKLIDLNKEDQHGRRALHIAAGKGDLSAVENYLRRKLEIDALDKDHQTALLDAVNSAEPRIVGTLIDAGANVNLADAYGQTPIYLAAVTGNKKIVELLIAAKADINARTTNGRRPLIVAEAGHHYEIAKMLRSAGAKR